MKLSRLAKLLCLVPLVGCGGEEVPAADPSPAPVLAQVPPLSAEEQAAAAEVYRKASCWTCHGHERVDGMAGPDLRGLGQHWTPESLAEFFADPAAVAARDPRLSEQAARYPVPMARPIRPLGSADRLLLARWLLAHEP
jgi:mono/diheme cytochrome c family protein